MMPYMPLKINRRFGKKETSLKVDGKLSACHLLSRWFLASFINMEAACTSETSVDFPTPQILHHLLFSCVT
jgi:hypothetical protein